MNEAPVAIEVNDFSIEQQGLTMNSVGVETTSASGGELRNEDSAFSVPLNISFRPEMSSRKRGRPRKTNNSINKQDFRAELKVIPKSDSLHQRGRPSRKKRILEIDQNANQNLQTVYPTSAETGMQNLQTANLESTVVEQVKRDVKASENTPPVKSDIVRSVEDVHANAESNVTRSCYIGSNEAWIQTSSPSDGAMFCKGVEVTVVNILTGQSPKARKRRSYYRFGSRKDKIRSKQESKLLRNDMNSGKTADQPNQRARNVSSRFKTSQRRWSKKELTAINTVSSTTGDDFETTLPYDKRGILLDNAVAFQDNHNSLQNKANGDALNASDQDVGQLLDSAGAAGGSSIHNAVPLVNEESLLKAAEISGPVLKDESSSTAQATWLQRVPTNTALTKNINVSPQSAESDDKYTPIYLDLNSNTSWTPHTNIRNGQVNTYCEDSSMYVGFQTPFHWSTWEPSYSHTFHNHYTGTEHIQKQYHFEDKFDAPTMTNYNPTHCVNESRGFSYNTHHTEPHNHVLDMFPVDLSCGSSNVPAVNLAKIGCSRTLDQTRNFDLKIPVTQETNWARNKSNTGEPLIGYDTYREGLRNFGQNAKKSDYTTPISFDANSYVAIPAKVNKNSMQNEELTKQQEPNKALNNASTVTILNTNAETVCKDIIDNQNAPGYRIFPKNSAARNSEACLSKRTEDTKSSVKKARRNPIFQNVAPKRYYRSGTVSLTANFKRMTLDSPKKAGRTSKVEKAFEKNIKEFLTILVEKPVLKLFGWPSVTGAQLLENVIKGCGYSPTCATKTSPIDRLRRNTRMLLIDIIDDPNATEILKNYPIDDAVVRLLTIARQSLKPTQIFSGE